MYYKIERTYLTDADGDSHCRVDAKPHLVPATSAPAAAAAFIAGEQATLLGGASGLPGDKATATGSSGRGVFVIFIERAAEAIRDVRPERRPSL
ncbi:MAG TPA: hypothetical protein VNA04_14055 [Thermoanaerobaculia bacterium]|nr:hypothetical protein [Thermoanaerobaculia bacterium]